MSWQFLRQLTGMDGPLPHLVGVKICSFKDLMHISGLVRTSSVKFCEEGCSKKWHCFMSRVDSTLGKVRVLKTSVLNVLDSHEWILWRKESLAHKQRHLIVGHMHRANRGTQLTMNLRSACLFQIEMIPALRSYIQDPGFCTVHKNGHDSGFNKVPDASGFNKPWKAPR